MKKIITAIVLAGAAFGITACSDADIASQNLSAAADEITRLRAQNAELLEALRWYAEGGEFRLSFDNGDIAATALAKIEDINK